MYLGDNLNIREFAKTAALTFAYNNVRVYLFENLRPTPILSFTARELGCQDCKEQGLTLYEALINLYEEYGFTKEDLVSIELQGKESQEKIGKCLNSLREDKITEVNGVKAFYYHKTVLKYILEDNSWFVVRPSDIEPKMKVYLSVVGESLKDSEEKLAQFNKNVMNIINSKLN